MALLRRPRPDDRGAREALRLLPDLVRLVRRLAADRSLPRGSGDLRVQRAAVAPPAPTPAC
jgi:hypothetical protein